MLQPKLSAKTKSRTTRSSAAKSSVAKSSADTDLAAINVKKHAAAIHTDGQLSLLERKLSNVLLVNAYDNLLTQPEHEIDEKALCAMLGYNSNDRKPIKQALKALASINAEWDILAKDGSELEWGVASLLSHAVLSRGRCRYGYSPALAEKLYNPTIYASINMRIQRQFRSGHALALYENCLRFKRVGSTGWLPLQLFRRLLGVGESDYYKSFKHLNAKIIKPVVREINKHSDIEIEPEFKKSGRSIAEIRFLIRPNPQHPLIDLNDDDSLKGTPLHDRLMALGVSHKLAVKWLSEHGEDYVREKLDYADAQRAGGKIRGSVTGYLNAAITQDYQTEKVVPLRKKRAAARAGRVGKGAGVAASQRAAQAKALAESEARAADRAKTRAEILAAKTWLEAQPDHKILLAAFRKTLTKPGLRAELRDFGLDAPRIGTRLVRFTAERRAVSEAETSAKV